MLCCMSVTTETNSKILFVCYHYATRNDEFRRIWGTSFNEFKKQICFLERRYPPLPLERLLGYIENNEPLPQRCSFISFDDGLREHSEVFAPYLAKRHISATFFPPACIFDTIMPGVQIVHFLTARFGIRMFYEWIKKYFVATDLSFDEYFYGTSLGTKNLLDLYQHIKRILYYVMPPVSTEMLLQTLYREIIDKHYPNFVSRIHMTEKELANIHTMGHSVGVHTYSHISFTNTAITDDMWLREIDDPKRKIESIITSPIHSFAYPFGGNIHQFDFDLWKNKLKSSGFSVAFNAYKKYQGNELFDPFWLERYAVQSHDDSSCITQCAYPYSNLKFVL